VNRPFTVPTECDLIMEGGVTSGVVFPSLIARLATRFDLRRIGGTSVGAVAASAAAAAQFRRNACIAAGDARHSEQGFDRLANLAKELQKPRKNGKSTLFSLFQPCTGLRRHFAVLSSVLNRKSVAGRLAAGVSAAILHCRELPFAGALLCLLGYALGQVSLLALVPILAVTIVLCAALQFGASAYLALCRNKFGMCPGIGPDPAEPALTQWLHGLIQDVAFGSANHAPLTFGDLQRSPKSIDLALMSTGLAERRAHRLPHDSRNLLFRRSEMLTLFPEDVVDHLCKYGRAVRGSRPAIVKLLSRADPGIGTDQADMFYLPAKDDLPIVFAARLSLSFPVLLQAVPLLRLRYVEGDGVRDGALALAPIWLSDGGLASNFPMHFFDELLPERPAFGIALENTLAEGAPAKERIKLPCTNKEGMVGSHLSVNNPEGKPSLFSFLSAMLNTSRGWRDEALKLTPGYRDRIVRIRHTAKEGGLNLNMPAEAIAVMSASGVEAANAIIDRFIGADGSGDGWQNHRWVRVRSTAAVLQDTIAPLVKTWNASAHSPSYRDMWDGALPGLPASYKINSTYREAGLAFWEALETGVADSGVTKLRGTVPSPHPSLAITPKQC